MNSFATSSPRLDTRVLAVAVTLAVIAVLAATVPAFSVLRRPHGVVPRALVADRRFRVAALIGFGAFGGLYSILFAAPQILVRGHGWTVLVAGLALLPPAVLGAVLSRMATRMAAAVGAYRLLALLIAQVSAAAPADLRGAATGLLQLSHVTGGAIGSAVAGALSLAFTVPEALLATAVLPLFISWRNHREIPAIRASYRIGREHRGGEWP